MVDVLVLSSLEYKNFIVKNGKDYISIKFSGVCCGESFKEIYVENAKMVKPPSRATLCICKIHISSLEKNRITGKLESIKFLEEFS